MASNNLKGLTIEIGGDTSNLQTALKGTNSEIANLQHNLRSVETALKLDPGNVTALTQKQQLLTEAVSATAQKLETLKEAQRQADEQMARGGDVDQTAYRNLQSEIARTEASLNDYKKQVKDTNSQLEKAGVAASKAFKDVGEEISKAGDKIEKVGKDVSVVSGAVAAVGGAAIAAFESMDSGYDTIVKKTGATGDALEDLNEVAEDIYSSLAENFDNVGAAVGETNTRFGLTGDALNELSTRFLKFANLNEQDVSTAIGNTSKILNTFSLGVESAGGVMDMLTSKAQETGIGMDALQNDLINNAATFKELGMGIEESINLLALFETNGVNTSAALMGLRKAVLAGVDSGKSLDESLNDVINSIKNAKTETDALAIAQEVFGTRGAVEMATAIRDGRITLDDLADSMSNYDGVVETTYGNMVDSLDDAEIAYNKLKLAGSDLGGTIMDALVPIIEKLTGLVQGVSEWFGNLDAKTQSVILTIAGLVAALGPVILITGKIISAIGSIVSGIGTIIPLIISGINALKSMELVTKLVTAAQWLWNAAMMANPIGLIIAGVAALAAGITALVFWLKSADGETKKYTESIKANAESVTAFSDALAAAAPTLLDTKDLLTATGKKMSDLETAISDTETAITDILSAALSEQRQLREDELASIKEYNKQLEELQKEKLQVYRQQMTTELMKINAESEAITQEGAAQYVANLDAALSAASDISEQNYNARLTEIYNFHQAQGTLDSQAYLNDIQTAKAAYEAELADSQDYYDDAMSALTNHSRAWVAQDADKWNVVLKATRGSNKEYAKALSELDLDQANAFLSMYKTAKDGGADISDETRATSEAMLESFEGLPKGMKESGKAALLGIIDGMDAKIPALENASEMSADEIVSTLREELGIYEGSGSRGKSSVMETVGEQVGDGLSDGLENKRQTLLDKIKSIGAAIVAKFKSIFDIHSPSRIMRDEIGKQLPAGIGEGVAENADAATRPMKDLVDDMTDLNGLALSRNITHAFDTPAGASLSLSALEAKFDALLAAVDLLIEKSDKDVYLDKRTLVGKLASSIDEALGDIAARKAVGAL